MSNHLGLSPQTPYVKMEYAGVIFYGDVKLADEVAILPGAHVGRPPMVTGSINRVPNKTGTTNIGKGSIIGANAIIYAGVTIGKRVLVGDGATIRENTWIEDDAIIGNNVTIQNNVHVGKRSRVLDLSHITAGVDIGEDVFVSVAVITMNDNSMGQGDNLVPPQIGSRSRIGGGAALLPGMVVGEDALVATGAVVTHPVGNSVRVQGIPARPYPVTRKTSDEIWHEYYFNQSGETGIKRSLDGEKSAD